MDRQELGASARTKRHIRWRSIRPGSCPFCDIVFILALGHMAWLRSAFLALFPRQLFFALKRYDTTTQPPSTHFTDFLMMVNGRMEAHSFVDALTDGRISHRGGGQRCWFSLFRTPFPSALCTFGWVASCCPDSLRPLFEGAARK